ncbi:MAG: metallophosphoesterase [Chloroflexota bacterium]
MEPALPSTRIPRPSARRSLLGIGVALWLVLGGPVAAADPGTWWLPDPSSVAGTAAPAAPTPATLLIAGDVATCDSTADEATARLVAGIPGTVMTAGDNVYPAGTATAYRDCYAPSWGELKDRTWPVAGNHEWMVPGAAGYHAYFGPRTGPGGRTWYAMDVGTWRVYALDSDCWAVGGCAEGSPQLRWLETDLAAHPRACVLAVWHHPRFSSGPHGNDREVAPLVAALVRAGAELVINGHDHQYERFDPARADGTPARFGVRQIVVGTGGGPLYAFAQPFAPNSVVRLRRHGVLRLDLGEGTYAWSFLAAKTGAALDTGTGRCH